MATRQHVTLAYLDKGHTANRAPPNTLVDLGFLEVVKAPNAAEGFSGGYGVGLSKAKKPAWGASGLFLALTSAWIPPSDLHWFVAAHLTLIFATGFCGANSCRPSVPRS